jgi:hypothetical protein
MLARLFEHERNLERRERRKRKGVLGSCPAVCRRHPTPRTGVPHLSPFRARGAAQRGPARSATSPRALRCAHARPSLLRTWPRGRRRCSRADAGPGEVVLKLHATGLCNSDVRVYLGERAPPASSPPRTPAKSPEVGQGADAAWARSSASPHPLLRPLPFCATPQLLPSRKTLGYDLDGGIAEYVRVLPRARGHGPLPAHGPGHACPPPRPSSSCACSTRSSRCRSRRGTRWRSSGAAHGAVHLIAARGAPGLSWWSNPMPGGARWRRSSAPMLRPRRRKRTGRDHGRRTPAVAVAGFRRSHPAASTRAAGW